MKKGLYGLGIFILCISFAGVAFALTPVQKLGEKLYFDENLSEPIGQSCASCHDPNTGFVDPDSDIPVSAGASGFLHGGRNSPSAAYAAFSPAFRFDEVSGLYVGGQFWDGREASLAGQAAGPFRNPVEMAMPDKKSVVERLQQDSSYQDLFKAAFNTEDGPFDLSIVAIDNQAVLEAYDLMAKAIGEFEKSQMFNKFNSRYDYFLSGDTAALSKVEKKGLKLFEKAGMCGLCHISTPSIAPDEGAMPPLFTDFTYDNLGIPKNYEIDSLIEEPQGEDYGLGGAVHVPAYGQPPGSRLQDGKFKVMSLRNIEITAPYGHNGYFPNLESIVHFYNTRDPLACSVNPGFKAATTKDLDDMNIPGWPGATVATCWPDPEVGVNVNDAELGNLGLSLDDEAKIVAFLKALTDRPLPPAPGGFAPVFSAEFFPPMP